MQFDKIEDFHGSTIQHGKSNDRIYLMKMGGELGEELPTRLIEFARQHGYSKIFAKAGLAELPLFISSGFVVESFIPHYFDGADPLFMICFYLSGSRREEALAEDYASVLDLAKAKAADGGVDGGDSGDEEFRIRPCTSSDIPQMVSIYREVFPSYPFPIHDPEYLQQTMDDNVDYYCAEAGNDLAAISSAEIDFASKNAEMTDFATLPVNRKKGLAVRLLREMEKGTAARGIKTFYTIARAISPGMNITFSRSGYRFGGRLINNTNISGSIESMNVWYKSS